MQILHRLHDILAIPARIGQPRILLKNPTLDAAAQVLREVAVEFRIDLPDDPLGVDLDARFV